MLLYSPFGFALTITGNPVVAIVGGALTIGGGGIPDVDLKTNLVKHRGWTHTIWFALLMSCIGCALTTIMWYGLPESIITITGVPPTQAVLVGAFLGVGVGTHILGDMLTPTGVRPFHPTTPKNIGGLTLSEKRYTLDMVNASDKTANSVFFILGILSTITTVYLSTLVI